MKVPTEPTHATFLKDVANHEMDIKLDQGVYRHLVFHQPGHTFLYRFELITTPWRLMITGDMGTWVFARLEDMFEFFRTDSGRINCGYWAEKLKNGVSGTSKEAKVYDGDAYRQRLIASLDGYDLEDEQKALIVEDLESLDFDDEHWILGQINDFEVDLGYSKPFTFQDVWEVDMTIYSYHFVWCLYAIVWGIAQYDARDRGVSDCTGGNDGR